MYRKNHMIMATFVLTFGLVAMGFGAAAAEVNLRWSPTDTTLAPGDTARVGVYLDEPLSIRTIEIWATYDTTVVARLDGGPGRLFTDSGYFIFEDFASEPGQWHGLAVVMGAGLYLTGPGELVFWDVEALAEGVCPIETLAVVLYDEQAPPELVPDVYLDSGSIVVQDPLSAAGDVPAAAGRLSLYPNPFNPSLQVGFHLEADTDARLTVHDARGRQVSVLGSGLMSAGEQVFRWNGKDDTGRVLPAGVYVFRLEAGDISEQAKAVLIK